MTPAAEMARVRAEGDGAIQALVARAGTPEYGDSYQDLPAGLEIPASAPIEEVDADGVHGLVADTTSDPAVTSQVTAFAVNP